MQKMSIGSTFIFHPVMEDEWRMNEELMKKPCK